VVILPNIKQHEVMRKLLLFLPVFLLAIYAGAQDCPNGDFENWVSHPYNVPDSNWYTSNVQSLSQADTLTVWKVTGHSGQAIHLQTAIIGTDTLQAYAINTAGDPKSGSGGVPYTQKPTSITGYYRYNMVANDSALMIIEFKKAGVVISATQFTFRNVSGSISTFTAFSFPLNAIPATPDSVIIGIASSNLEGTGIQSGSWLEIDELAFAGTGITEPIAGGSFDSWTAQTVDNPSSWTAETHGDNGTGVAKSTDHRAGSYSVQLTTQPGRSGGGSGNSVEVSQITTGNYSPNSGPRGGLPYTRTSDTISGFYKYIPAGTDTGMLLVMLTASGTVVGGANHFFNAASAWTYFEMPFSAGTTPDTIRIDIQSGSWTADTAGSVLKVDYLQLKSQPLLAVNDLTNAAAKVLAYPNPANDVFNLRFDKVPAGSVNAKIYDLMGRVIDSRNYTAAPSVISFQVGYLPTGMYFYEVSNNGNIMRDKFMKK